MNCLPVAISAGKLDIVSFSFSLSMDQGGRGSEAAVLVSPRFDRQESPATIQGAVSTESGVDLQPCICSLARRAVKKIVIQPTVNVERDFLVGQVVSVGYES